MSMGLEQWAGPAAQFIKYAICGVIATGVDILVFYLCAWRVYPALREDDPVVRRFGVHVRHVDEAVRSRRFVYCTVTAFMFSNLTAYVLNALWVFQPGRHSRVVEILLFFLVSSVSVALGAFLGWLMIRFARMSTTASYAGKLISSLLLNFVCRKCIVFRG